MSGKLTIGTGLLGFSDFKFTDLGGMKARTFTLITSSGISGTLNSSDLKGLISGETAMLQMNGNNLELVVLPSGTVIYLR